jgi:raffinose synthase
VDYFGWCTWDSFYTDLSVRRVIGGLESFKGTGVVPRFMILDDGWQSTTVDDKMNGFQWGGRLTSFNANFKFSDDDHEERELVINPPDVASSAGTVFAQGEVLEGSAGVVEASQSQHSLAHLAEQIKSHHGIKFLLVWHTLSGYWAGVHVADSSPDESCDHDYSGSEQKSYPNVLSKYRPEVSYPVLTPTLRRMSHSNALDSEPFTVDGVGLIHPGIAEAFFNDYHRNLKSMGVDGVKVGYDCELRYCCTEHEKPKTNVFNYTMPCLVGRRTKCRFFPKGFQRGRLLLSVQVPSGSTTIGCDELWEAGGSWKFCDSRNWAAFRC